MGKPWNRIWTCCACWHSSPSLPFMHFHLLQAHTYIHTSISGKFVVHFDVVHVTMFALVCALWRSSSLVYLLPLFSLTSSHLGRSWVSIWCEGKLSLFKSIQFCVCTLDEHYCHFCGIFFCIWSYICTQLEFWRERFPTFLLFYYSVERCSMCVNGRRVACR